MSKVNLGAVTAYADAVAHGYTGSREEFGEQQAGFAENARQVAKNLEESKQVLTSVKTDVETVGTEQVQRVENVGAAEVENIHNAANERLADFDAVGAVRFDRQELDTAQKAQARANINAGGAIECTASGEVVTLDDSSDQPLRGLRIYGKSTQDGTPTPENPVPIVSVGDAGTITGTVTGKNLWEHGDISAVQYFTKITHLKPGTYTFSAKAISDDADDDKCLVIFMPELGNDYTGGISLFLNRGSRESFVVTISKAIKQVRFYAAKTYETSAQDKFTFSDIQIELGETATTYEPYKDCGSVAISTPNGLPGIPVESGGNYTDANGQQWICDEVDFAKGTYVQRIGKYTFDGSSDEGWKAIVTSHTETSGHYRNIANIFFNQILFPPASSIAGVLLCSHYVTKPTGSAGSWGEVQSIGVENASAGSGAGSIIVYDENYNTDDITQWTAWLAENPIDIVYALATPVETPLTETELTAYRAMHTNKPNTTIYTDEGAGVSVDYAADTKTYIDQKFAELAAAIVAGE